MDALYSRFGDPLYSLCYRMLGNREEAEEALQDVLVRIWRKAPSYDPARSAPFSWMVMMTRSICVDKLRGRRKIVPFNLEIIQDPADDTVQSPASSIELEEGTKELKEKLFELPEDQRLCIEMAFFGGQTHREIAEVLNEPLGTVKARIRRGLSRMRKLVSS